MYAVITGAASGIGREIARQIAQRGLALVVTDRDEDRLATLVDELERACGNRSPILDATIIGLPWHAAYSASKAGVLGMCEVLRFDLAPHGVSVHVAVPGAVDTPLVRTVDIDGVDRSQPRVARLTKLFQRHAITPEKAAQKIIRGVDRDKFLIPTSADVPLARVAKVLAPWAYRGVMRGLNRGFRWAAAKQHR